MAHDLKRWEQEEEEMDALEPGDFIHKVAWVSWEHCGQESLVQISQVLRFSQTNNLFLCSYSGLWSWQRSVYKAIKEEKFS